MFIVTTRVKIKAGMVGDCAKLFRETNPELVAPFTDWISATMSVDRNSNVVTVAAVWSDLNGYHKLSASDAFSKTMRRFAGFFKAPPEISISEKIAGMERSGSDILEQSI